MTSPIDVQSLFLYVTIQTANLQLLSALRLITSKKQSIDSSKSIKLRMFVTCLAKPSVFLNIFFIPQTVAVSPKTFSNRVDSHS
jgi:hypothetical protein